MSGYYNGTFWYIQFQIFNIHKLQKSCHAIGYFGNIDINIYLDRRYMYVLDIKKKYLKPNMMNCLTLETQ
jgi:hypothetical protein